MNAKQVAKPQVSTAAKSAAKTPATKKVVKPEVVRGNQVKPKKVKPPKDVKCTFTLPEPEYDAVQTLRERLSEAVGRKVKKSEILHLAARILLVQTPAKLKAELGKMATA